MGRQAALSDSFSSKNSSAPFLSRKTGHCYLFDSKIKLNVFLMDIADTEN